MNFKSSTLWLTVGALLVVGGMFALLVTYSEPAEQTPDTRTNREVALSCTTDMATTYHIHPQLSIFVDGVPEVLPANIGIVSGCMHPLHTHDADGIVHVESPVKRDFTLADFYAVWEQSIYRQGYDVNVIVDGEVIDLPDGGIDAIVLEDEQQIEIRYTRSQE